jgi:hypothetical protein
LLAQCLELLGQSQAAAEQRRQAEKTQRLKKELEDTAIEAGREVLSDKPRLRAARLSFELGDHESARQWAIAGLACNPHNEELQRLLRQIDKPVVRVTGTSEGR